MDFTKRVDLVFARDKVKTHNLIANIYTAELVFNEGDYYPPVNRADYQDEGRECDDYLIVEPEHKALVFQRLVEDLPAGSQVPQDTDPDKQLLKIIEQTAPLKKWKSLADIEKWLVEKQIPFKKDHWLEIG